VTLIDAVRPAEWVNQAGSDQTAAFLGLVPGSRGLVAWDVFDAVLTPGDVILLMSWKKDADAEAFEHRACYQATHDFVESAWFATTACSTGERRHNFTRTLAPASHARFARPLGPSPGGRMQRGVRLPPEEPVLTLYVAGFEEIAWGVALVAITMVLHGLGMVWTLRAVNGLKMRLGSDLKMAGSLFVLVVAAWLITVSHLVEVLAWASFILWKGAMPNASMAYYLALLDYTTLGCEYDLPANWRLLEGMIAISGLMTFAWSTGVLFALAQEFQARELQRDRRAAS
jgi:hypothetical protein